MIYLYKAEAAKKVVVNLEKNYCLYKTLIIIILSYIEWVCLPLIPPSRCGDSQFFPVALSYYIMRTIFCRPVRKVF